MNNPGYANMMKLEHLPLLTPPGVTVCYEGSIDKVGNNADWDWWLYQEKNSGEWVLLDVDGPGCLMNFVVHHAVSHSDPLYRFYFDGDDSPAYEIRHSEFGSKAPFLEPLAGYYSPAPKGENHHLTNLDFRIVRSFIPMAFRKGCRITSSVKLKGNTHVYEGGGGWGHAIYHTYPTAEGITTFNAKDDYTGLFDLWKRCGGDPKPVNGNVKTQVEAELGAGETKEIYYIQDTGSLDAIGLKIGDFQPGDLGDLWIHLTWDGEETPAVSAPLGAFFGSELGNNCIYTLMQSVDTNGELKSFWPMPFWSSAQISLENRGERTTRVSGSIEFKPSTVQAYPREESGHFRASAYQPLVAKKDGFDSHIATLKKCHGHMVSGIITAIDGVCEGDVRVHLDGASTPDVESDGSESWSCYGWGFHEPPQMNPASSYDGPDPRNWSMVRLLMGDFYPFRQNLRMTVEGEHGHHRGTDRRSGLILWYGDPGETLRQSDFLDIGDAASEANHSYKAPGSTPVDLTASYEGEFDQQKIQDCGRKIPEQSEFTVSINPANRGVRMLRRSDQQYGMQRAEVYVDGEQVTERDWFRSDRNPFHRWLDDAYEIPMSYTAGKSELHIRLVNISAGKGKPFPEDAPVFPADDEQPSPWWSEFSYTVFSHLQTPELS